VKGFGEAIDPLARKVLKSSGAGIVETLPEAMIDWVKDSTLIVNEYQTTIETQLGNPVD
jgi:hypothetical protein